MGMKEEKTYAARTMSREAGLMLIYNYVFISRPWVMIKMTYISNSITHKILHINLQARTQILPFPWRFWKTIGIYWLNNLRPWPGLFGLLNTRLSSLSEIFWQSRGKRRPPCLYQTLEVHTPVWRVVLILEVS